MHTKVLGGNLPKALSKLRDLDEILLLFAHPSESMAT
jgi:hypothetical protein